ncbi:MAG: hypothetical protein EOR63_32265 [Mesorhizobium sp.]|nr:MAG: hypothetical protein EOR63_32265 [Mesorhizobium sp.]
MTGYTYAEAEYLGDKELLARIRRAEAKSGKKTGQRYTRDENGKLVTHRVSVSFYPKTKFSIEDQAPDGGEFSNLRELEESEYEKTFGLTL